MKVSSILNLILLLLLASCDGCKKDDPKPKTELEKLPPATQEGKDTFGCLVNGKAWVIESTTNTDAVYQIGILQIFGRRYEPFLSLEMSILEKYYGGSLAITTYPLNKFPDSSCSAYLESSTQSCKYESQSCISGKILLTKLDRVKYIVSGTFHFVTVAKDCDTLKITNGRFDIRYTP